jgi:ubiquitin-protein ligase
MPTRFVLLVTLALITAFPGTSPWDRPPEQWSKVDTLRVLQDSPWSPAKVKLDAKLTYRHTDPQSGIVTDSPLNPTDRPPVHGIEFARHKAAPPITVLWWSSKTVRAARLRLQQLMQSPNVASPVQVDAMSDYVLAIEGDEPLRIFGSALEKVQDTVFLETAEGTTIDLQSIRLVNAPDDGPRVEFHFPRQINGQPSLDATAERVTLHCRATAKTPIAGRTNTIAFRAEFEPRAMVARGVSDL